MPDIKIIAYDQDGEKVHELVRWLPEGDQASLRALVQCQRNNPRTVAAQYSVDGTVYPAVYFDKYSDMYEPDPTVFDVFYQAHEIMERTIH